MNRRFAPLNGVLLLDKPTGVSSNAALQRARRLFCAEKAGHAGTLDPFASGLLPIAFGEATKLLQFSLLSDKKYRATLRLGITTETGDIEGAVIEEKSARAITEDHVLSVLKTLEGDQEQTPPMYSALKYLGKPYYEYARRGIAIPRPSRPVRIFSLDLVAFDPPYVGFDAHVSKGTYIRTLAETIGERLGCGAHLTALRRAQSGALTLENAKTFEILEAAAKPEENRTDSIVGSEHEESALIPDTLLKTLLPIDTLISELPRITLPPAEEKRFLQGQRLGARDPESLQNASVFAIENERHALVGIGKIKDGTLHPTRVLNV